MARMPTLTSQAAAEAMRSVNQGKKSTPDGAEVFDVTERRHVKFNLYEGHWRFLKESFEGGPEYLYKGIGRARAVGRAPMLSDVNHRNLFQYFKEGNDEYNDRLLRAHRVNYSRRVVNQIGSFLAKKPPVRRTEAASPAVQAFWNDTDGRKVEINEAMSNVRQWMLALGLIWISIDKPNTPFMNREDELKDGLPFMKLWFPFDVLDAGYDDRERLKWILVREWRRFDDNPLMASPVMDVFTIWNRERWTSMVRNPKASEQPNIPFIIVGGEEHNLGFVPFKPVRLAEDSSYAFVSPGLLDDVSYLDRSIFNLQSQLDTVINDQTFSQLAIPADSLTLNSPDRMEGGDGVTQDAQMVRRRMVEMGTKRVFLFNGAAQHAPRYIAPDAAQADVYRALIKDRQDEIYRITGLLDQVGREVKTQSGTSKAYDFDRINKMLVQAAERLNSAEMWIAQTVDAQMSPVGETVPEIDPELVQYADNYDVMGILEMIDITGRSDEVDLWSPTLSAKQRERILERMEPNLEPPVRAKILREIADRAKREIDMAKKFPLDPMGDPDSDPDGDEDGEPSQTRGAGGGAKGPQNSQLPKPVSSTADRVAGGNRQNER